MSVLLAAREWGRPPWELAGGAKVLWYLRWIEFNNLTAERDKKNADRLTDEMLR